MRRSLELEHSLPLELHSIKQNIFFYSLKSNITPYYLFFSPAHLTFSLANLLVTHLTSFNHCDFSVLNGAERNSAMLSVCLQRNGYMASVGFNTLDIPGKRIFRKKVI